MNASIIKLFFLLLNAKRSMLDLCMYVGWILMTISVFGTFEPIHTKSASTSAQTEGVII